jgi:hypothetical protein
MRVYLGSVFNRSGLQTSLAEREQPNEELTIEELTVCCLSERSINTVGVGLSIVFLAREQ